MRRELATVAVLAILAITMGCTGEPQTAPKPENPTEPLLLDAQDGVAYGLEYMSGLYKGSTVIHPFTVTHTLLGKPCAWNGTDAGNTTRWMLYIEGIMLNSGTYRFIEFAVDIHLRNGEMFASHVKIQINVLPQDKLNATAAGIDKVSLEPYLNVSSHDIFLKADAHKLAPDDRYYLQSINISLNHNTTSRYSPDIAAWEVAYRYIKKTDYSPAVSVVVLNAVTLDIIKVVPPR